MTARKPSVLVLGSLNVDSVAEASVFLAGLVGDEQTLAAAEWAGTSQR